MTKPTPPYLAQALALARAAKAAGVPRLAAWGDQLEQAIEASQAQEQDTDAPTVKNSFPFVRSGD
jgi:HPt (histidine-containing phosphotransfer) domain-containing protein